MTLVVVEAVVAEEAGVAVAVVVVALRPARLSRVGIVMMMLGTQD